MGAYKLRDPSRASQAPSGRSAGCIQCISGMMKACLRLVAGWQRFRIVRAVVDCRRQASQASAYDGRNHFILQGVKWASLLSEPWTLLCRELSDSGCPPGKGKSKRHRVRYGRKTIPGLDFLDLGAQMLKNRVGFFSQHYVEKVRV